MKWTAEKIINGLQAAAINGVVNYRDAARIEISLPTMAMRRYGSFEAACAEAGLMNARAAKLHYEICVVINCSLLVRSIGSPYCEKHYARLRRNGTTERINKARGRYYSTNGYTRIHVPDHPLLQKHGPSGSYEYEHRVIYYNANGEGPFECYWCGNQLRWETMHIDHLNNDKQDNRLENLKPSCPRCNQKRGVNKMKTAMRNKGRQLQFNGRKMCMSEWAREIGITPASLRARLNSGWLLERALVEPRGKTGPRIVA